MYSAINITKRNSGSRRLRSRREFYVVSKIKESYVVSVKDRVQRCVAHEFKEEMCYGGLKKETAEQFIRKLGGAIRTDYHLILSCFYGTL